MERSPLEVWGGIESTHNRVGDVCFDQLGWGGHATRIGDLDLIAALAMPGWWRRPERLLYPSR